MTTPSRQISRRQKNPFLLVLVLVMALPLVAVPGMLVWWAVDRFFAPDIVTRVLFAETAGCTAQERALVAGVMQNRVGNPAFGDARTLKEVVEQPGAFSCIGDSANGNWRLSRHPERMNAAERAAWEACVACLRGPIVPAVGPSGRPLVYYHDKSIGMPAAWEKGEWRAVLEVTTGRFKFYSVVPAKGAK